jgi:hypothetical protein
MIVDIVQTEATTGRKIRISRTPTRNSPHAAPKTRCWCVSPYVRKPPTRGSEPARAVCLWQALDLMPTSRY